MQGNITHSQTLETNFHPGATPLQTPCLKPSFHNLTKTQPHTPHKSQTTMGNE